MIKAQRLQPGDTLGVVSPSWGGAGLFPHRISSGNKQLERMGYKLKLGVHALNVQGWVSDTPENRAADIHALFRDPEIKAVIAAIGGDHANQLLPLLDWDLIRRHPKVFMGYSDITVLNLSIWKIASLVTFNGPAFLTDFAEYPEMFTYTGEYFRKAVCRAEPIGVVEPSPDWTEELLDWEQKLDLTRPRQMNPSPGWTWLKPGHAEGVLIGGCLDSMDHLYGTGYWPDESQWREAILYLETSEEAPPPARVDSLLMDFENMGIFDLIRGMLVGRPMRYSDEQKALLNEVILERTKKYSFPIITGMDFGHTAPQFCLPNGCRALIDGQNSRFAITEPAVI
jgi:muramoyltetrapeptide carboxypeptidase LdcA involved in peptidoglycan recycling